MRKMKFGILLVFAVLALISVASAALPSQVTATIASPGTATHSYWDVDVTNGGGDIPAASDYVGWCADSVWTLNPGTHIFNVYSSLEALPAGLPTVNWNKVNYVINHKDGANAATIQAVIWYYDHGEITWNPAAPLGPVNAADRAALIAAADANGVGYVPGPGDIYAVILWSSRTVQPVFIELPIPTIPSPEFPTLALPVAMLIGVVGAVQYIRARKE